MEKPGGGEVWPGWHLTISGDAPAGDLRSSRGQRIAIAAGSGAEAALNAFYASRFGR